MAADTLHHFHDVPIEDPPPDEPSKTWRSRLDLKCAASLEGKPVLARMWVVDQWIPLGHLTGLYGRGGGGKTTLAMQLCCATSIAGGHWLGMPARKSRPFGFFCEDDEDELERKIHEISQCSGHRRGEYGDFQYLARFGMDNLLFVRGQRGGLQTTDLYDDLCQMVADEHRDLLVFDGIPDIYGLSINDQGEVTWAMSKLLAMAKPTRATTLILGHPNKAGSAEYTGCGAWMNKPRGLLSLGHPKETGEEDADLNDPRRVLTRAKANLSARDDMQIMWDRGAFRAQHTDGGFGARLDREMVAGQARQVFLDALEQLTEQQRHLSHSTAAPNYAPKVMAEAKLIGTFTRKEIATAMNELFNEGRIVAGADLWRRKNRHVVTGIALVRR